MVCFYFYHPGGAPRFSWFSCVFIWWYFWCVLMCSCVLFLVRFSRVFCRAFSGVFWWFCWWYFWCFSWCFFHCVLVLFSVLFFVLVPFLFYIRFPLVVVLFFAVLFFVVFGCFFRAFFRAFCGVFFVSFIVLFFVHFFVLFLVFFFEFCFFVPWVAPETNNHNILHFGPCFFRCFFWWSLLVKIGYTQYIIIYIHVCVCVGDDAWWSSTSWYQSYQWLWMCDVGKHEVFCSCEVKKERMIQKIMLAKIMPHYASMYSSIPLCVIVASLLPTLRRQVRQVRQVHEH